MGIRVFWSAMTCSLFNLNDFVLICNSGCFEAMTCSIYYDLDVVSADWFSDA